MITEEERQKASEILSAVAEKNGMTVDDLIADLLPVIHKSYADSSQNHADFWEGFVPEGDEPTMDETIVWIVKKIKENVPKEEEIYKKAGETAYDSFRSTL